MFKPILFVALVAFVAAAPAKLDEEDKTEKPEIIAILKSESNQGEDGSYSFMFESADGSFRQENAEFVNQGTDEESIKITGSYKYIDANGDEVLVTYTADENGFVPVGTIIAKEISDNALAAKDLPKSEPEPEQLKSRKPKELAKPEVAAPKPVAKPAAPKPVAPKPVAPKPEPVTAKPVAKDLPKPKEPEVVPEPAAAPAAEPAKEPAPAAQPEPAEAQADKPQE